MRIFAFMIASMLTACFCFLGGMKAAELLIKDTAAPELYLRFDPETDTWTITSTDVHDEYICTFLQDAIDDNCTLNQ